MINMIAVYVVLSEILITIIAGFIGAVIQERTSHLSKSIFVFIVGVISSIIFLVLYGFSIGYVSFCVVISFLFLQHRPNQTDE